MELFIKLITLDKKEQNKYSIRKQHVISWNQDKRGSYWLIHDRKFVRTPMKSVHMKIRRKIP